MKYFAVCAFFPQAASHAAHQGPVTVRTSNIRLAAKHGLDRLMDAQGVKGKQIQTCKVEIQFIRKAVFEFFVQVKIGHDWHERPERFDTKKAAQSWINARRELERQQPDLEKIGEVRIMRREVK